MIVEVETRAGFSWCAEQTQSGVDELRAQSRANAIAACRARGRPFQDTESTEEIWIRAKQYGPDLPPQAQDR